MVRVIDPLERANLLEAEADRRRAVEAARRRELIEGPDLSVSDARAEAFERAKRVIVTAAMNNTAVDHRVWLSLRRAAEHYGAELAVIPIRYRNPTSPGEYTTRGPGWWWPDEVMPFLVGSSVRLHPHLFVMGDVRIQATAKNPLQGLEGFGRGASVIFGHAQLAMKLVATPQYDLPKMMHTTGTVSVPKYSSSKAGAEAEFHHSLGGLIIERDDDAFHVRQLCADASGGFYDLDLYFSPAGVTSGHRAAALLLGDTHVWFQDPGVTRATFEGAESIVGVTRPRRVIHSDVIDAFSITHHHRRNPVARFAKFHGQRSALEAELTDVARFLEATTPDDAELVVKASNHHEHVARWIFDTDWRDDPQNAELYLTLALEMVRAARITHRGAETIDPFAWWVERTIGRQIRFLARDESYRVCGVEMSLHGDAGPNGSRGTIRNLSKLGTRVFLDHTHAPGIEKGAWQVGTSTYLSLEYSKRSPSSWLNTHGLVHDNGQRQLVTIVKGRWRRVEP